MATNKKKGMKLEGISLDREVLQAMRAEGWLVPEAVQEVLEAERTLADAGISRNSSVERPRDLLRTANKVRSIRPSHPVTSSSGISDNLARAAREGGEISSEVEERMRRDRDAAEADKGD